MSEHFRYAAWSDDSTVCDGVAGMLETHFSLVHAYLDLDRPLVDRPIRYLKLRDQADLDRNSGCPPSAVACAGDHGIASARTLDGHELIHAYLRPLGRPPAMLEEGIAEALAPQGRMFVAPREDWRQVLAAPAVEPGVPAPIAYWAGGWFVAYLLRVHGPRPFLTFYAGVAPDAAPEEVALQFQAAYGVSLDDTWKQARASAPVSNGVPIWECAGAPVSFDVPVRELREQCDGAGPYSTFELAAATSLRWSDARLPAGFNLSGCGMDGSLHMQQLAWVGPGEIGALALPAGRYYLAPTVGAGSIGLRASTGVVGADCLLAAPFSLADEATHLTFGLANSDDAFYAKVDHSSRSSFELTRLWDDPIVPNEIVAVVEICADCATTACQPFDGLTSAQVATGSIFRLTNLVAPQGATLVRFGRR
jgi:hypothetical protein